MSSRLLVRIMFMRLELILRSLLIGFGFIRVWMREGVFGFFGCFMSLMIVVFDDVIDMI